MPKAGLGGLVPMCKAHMPDHWRMDARVDGRGLSVQVSRWPASSIEGAVAAIGLVLRVEAAALSDPDQCASPLHPHSTPAQAQAQAHTRNAPSYTQPFYRK